MGTRSQRSRSLLSMSVPDLQSAPLSTPLLSFGNESISEESSTSSNSICAAAGTAIVDSEFSCDERFRVSVEIERLDTGERRVLFECTEIGL
jgi:hypothetical protein